MMSETQEKLDAMTTKLDSVKNTVDGNGQLLSHVQTCMKDTKDSKDPDIKALEYLGCYYDDSNKHLPEKIPKIGDMITLTNCKENCKGYKYLDLQAGTFCLCVNELIKTGYSKVSHSECNWKCPGELNRMCGGAWRNSIYRV